MDWTTLDWEALDRLRAGFLSEAPRSEPYWESESALASYDLTYGERIGWKWDQVLRELELRRWQPPGGLILDWGCGAGVAGRRVLSKFGLDRFPELALWDHSPLATEYAAGRAMAEFPGLKVAHVTPAFLEAGDPIDLLVLSHVLNELTEEALAGLRRILLRARAVIWVEVGTSAVSRRLGVLRDELVSRFSIVAPCTHQLGCPMFRAGNERHWCHFFAPPPGGVFADRDWVKFGQRAGIDLRSLPYAFLAMERKSEARSSKLELENASSFGIQASDFRSRVIGRPEAFKPYVRFLDCDERGLRQVEVLKRDDPVLYKALDKTKEPLVLQWEGGRPGLLAPT